MSPRRPLDLLRPAPVLLLAAVFLEAISWAVGGGAGTTTFAWYRVQAHAGTTGLLLTFAAGLTAGGLAWGLLRSWPGVGTWFEGRRGVLLLGLAALALHLAFLDLPQAQPDTVNYFVYAQHFARDPLGTLSAWPSMAWGGPEASFHHPFPLVPLIYGLAFRLAGERWAVIEALLALFAVALPLAVAWVGRCAEQARIGLLAGWLMLGIPFLQCQTGWFLVDVPLLLLLCLAWGAMLRARSPGGLALALLACLPALCTKASAGLFLAGPLAAMATQHRAVARRWTLPLLALAGLGLLIWLYPPRLRDDPSTWLEALAATGIHLRPSLWLLGLPVLLGRGRLERTAAGVLLSLPVILLYAPPEHCPRYALPLAIALGLAAALRLRPAGPGAAALVASGLALCFSGYRPLLVHNQAANLQHATRAMEASGVSAIEVWSDQPGTNFAPAALAALVDLYAQVPVRFGGTLGLGEPESKRHWWEVYEPPAWHQPVPGEPAPDGVMLCLFGADATAFEQGPGQDLDLIEQISLYRSSSMLLPQRVQLYRRRAAGPVSGQIPVFSGERSAQPD